MAAIKLCTAEEERRQAKRNSLADKLTFEAKALADLKIEKAAVEGERRAVDADLGPVRYLAAFLGTDDESVLRYFILAVALLLDRRPSCFCSPQHGGRNHEAPQALHRRNACRRGWCRVPGHEEVVMRSVVVVLALVVSGSARGQVPQNPEACALLRADLDEAYNRFITSGYAPAEAMALMERKLEMRRKTGDPCFMPLAAPSFSARR